MKTHICFIVFIFFIVWQGCTSQSPEYWRVREATQKVLTKNSMIIYDSGSREDTIVAYSKQQGDFLSKNRVKVVARIFQNDQGIWDTQIRVVNQWDTYEPKAFGNPEYMTESLWINVGTNPALEAKLYNEIQIALGNTNHYSGKAWQVPPSPESYGVEPIQGDPVPGRPYDAMPDDEIIDEEMSHYEPMSYGVRFFED